MDETYPLIEEQEAQDTVPGTSAQASTAEKDKQGGCPMYFGVRSYLHHFYDRSPSPDLHTNFCQQCGDAEKQEKHRSRFGSRFIQKASYWIAINVTLIGMISMLIGFLIPKREIVIGFQDNLEVVDRNAVNYNEILRNFRAIGLGLVFAGNLLLIIALMISCISPNPNNDVDNDDDDATVCRLTEVHSIPNEDKIPVDEKIDKIQPEWQKANVY